MLCFLRRGARIIFTNKMHYSWWRSCIYHSLHSEFARGTSGLGWPSATLIIARPLYFRRRFCPHRRTRALTHLIGILCGKWIFGIGTATKLVENLFNSSAVLLYLVLSLAERCGDDFCFAARVQAGRRISQPRIRFIYVSGSYVMAFWNK